MHGMHYRRGQAANSLVLTSYREHSVVFDTTSRAGGGGGSSGLDANPPPPLSVGRRPLRGGVWHKGLGI